MTTETRTLTIPVPLASLLFPGFAADATAAQPLDLAPKKPSYGYDDEEEDDGYDDDEEDYDDEDDEEEDEEEDEEYSDDDDEDYDDEDEEDDEEEEDDEDEDEDIGYYTSPSGYPCPLTQPGFAD